MEREQPAVSKSFYTGLIHGILLSIPLWWAILWLIKQI